MNYYDILLAKKLAENEGGGGSSVEIEPLSVTENGTYTAEQGKAYSPVSVNVPTGSDLPTFTVTYDSDWETILSVSCNKTYAECYEIFSTSSYAKVLETDGEETDGEETDGYDAIVTDNDSTFLVYSILVSAFEFAYDIRYEEDGTLTVINPSSAVQLLNITQNGTYYPSIRKYISEVDVNVPQGVFPSGTYSITQNGIYDVTNFASASVNVSGGEDLLEKNLNGTLRGAYTYSGSVLKPYAFYNCPLLSSINCQSCSDIGASAFAYCNKLTDVSFPVCTSIGSNAFAYCYSLTLASFPSCTSIGSNAFYACSSLTSVYFPSCTTVGSSAFYSCSLLTSVDFPVCTSIGASAFYTCSSLTSVYFPSCTSIGISAFYACSSLTSVYFPSCTSIGAGAFYSCSLLTSVDFPVCTSIGATAFYGCSSLTSVSFSVCTYIGSNAFYGCISLTSVYFPVCKSMASNAFGYCYPLTSASFPSCTSIGRSVFQYCSSLTSLYLLNSVVATLSTSVFYYTPIDRSAYLGYFGSIFVPASLVDSYKTATNWASVSDRITAYTG